MYPHYEPGDMLLVSFDGGKTYQQHMRIMNAADAVYAKKTVEGSREQETCFKITAGRNTEPFLKYI